MQISAQKAIELGFVCDRNNNNIIGDYRHKSSVDLTIREILFKNKKDEVKSLSQVILKPQDSVFVISEEILHVPEGFIAYVFLKNRLSQKGFLALNTGIIDSNYNGPISTLLINFSAEETCLPITDNFEDKIFFRVVFHEIEKDTNQQINFTTRTPSYNVKEKYDEYRSFRISDLKKFPRTFLEPTVLKDQISKELTAKLSSISMTRIGIVFAGVGLFLSLISFGRDYYFSEKYDLNEFSKYKIETEVKVKNLEEKLEELKNLIPKDNPENLRDRLSGK